MEHDYLVEKSVIEGDTVILCMNNLQLIRFTGIFYLVIKAFRNQRYKVSSYGYREKKLF
jgi:hypothetical protein